MKNSYITPDLEISFFTIKDVVLASIINGDEIGNSGGVVVNPDPDVLDDGF